MENDSDRSPPARLIVVAAIRSGKCTCKEPPGGANGAAHEARVLKKVGEVRSAGGLVTFSTPKALRSKARGCPRFLRETSG